MNSCDWQWEAEAVYCLQYHQVRPLSTGKLVEITVPACVLRLRFLSGQYSTGLVDCILLWSISPMLRRWYFFTSVMVTILSYTIIEWTNLLYLHWSLHFMMSPTSRSEIQSDAETCYQFTPEPGAIAAGWILSCSRGNVSYSFHWVICGA